MRRHRDPDRLAMTIWTEDRLSAIALALTTSQSVVLRFVEGDPRTDCPLVGKRALIALEACARYAQGRGKVELRVHPVNSHVEALYTGVYGFERRKPHKEPPYLVKRV